MSNTNPTPLHTVQEHIASLAPVVRWLDQHPELDVDNVSLHTWTMRGLEVSMQIYEANDHRAAAERFAAATRALTDGAPIGTVRKVIDDNVSTTDVIRNFGDVTVRVWTSREAVCERVVVGTETVEIPDPDAPKVTVERDRVEWRCRPILADRGTEAVTA